MNPVPELSLLTTIAVSSLLLIGAAFTLVGAVGLLRLQTFYARIHAPTLGTTLGTACIAIASAIYFSVAASRLALHELVAVAFITVTTPIGLILLVRAALFRESREERSGNPAGTKK